MQLRSTHFDKKGYCRDDCTDMIKSLPNIGIESGVGGIVSPTLNKNTTSANRIVISRFTFFARFNRKEESEEGDEEYEEARCDQVDDVKETATSHDDCERHIRVEFGTACVLPIVTFG